MHYDYREGLRLAQRRVQRQIDRNADAALERLGFDPRRERAEEARKKWAATLSGMEQALSAFVDALSALGKGYARAVKAEWKKQLEGEKGNE